MMQFLKYWGSDCELAYASPKVIAIAGADLESIQRHQRKRNTRKRAFSDEEGKLAADGRKRRHRGSSDDEGNLTYDGFVNEDLRVGGPSLSAIPRKVRLLPKDHPLYEQITRNKQNLLHQMLTVLNRHDIHPSDVNFYETKSVFHPAEKSIVVVLVTATRADVDQKWLQASREIRANLILKGLAAVSVEIADPAAYESPRIFPVQKTDAVSSKWNQVLNCIMEETGLDDIQTVGCYRMGRSSEPTENPPTVLVTVSPSSERVWKGPRELIIGVLNKFGLPMVAVEIVKDKIVTSTLGESATFEREVVLGPARMGQSLAPAGNTSASGTLGGLIELRNPKSKQWDLFGLTCFHCVLPDANQISKDMASQFRVWEEKGIHVNDPEAAKNLQVDHPSLRDMKEKLDELALDIRDIETDRNFQDMSALARQGLGNMMSRMDKLNLKNQQEQLAEYRNFSRAIQTFRNSGRHLLGHVAWASGLRTRRVPTIPASPDLTSMDWALIRVRKGREASNLLPSGTSLRNFKQGESKDLAKRTLQIYGRSSGLSKGLYHHLWTARVLKRTINGKETTILTKEHAVTDIKGNRFSQRGDSGALVHLPTGQLVGMIFAGHESQKLSYFTHVDDLFTDIMESTKAAGIRLAGAGVM